MVKVFIDGQEGTTGLRIAERLTAQSNIELLSIPEALRKDSDARRQRINQSDVTILCLPDEAAIESVSLIENPQVKVIDASTAHRTALGWAYGFPELSPTHRDAVATGMRVTVPGCHAGGFAALAYPLVSHGVIAQSAPLVCHSLTGYSGGGKKMIAEYEAADKRAELFSPRQYGLSQVHKHLPEMRHVCGLTYPPLFHPIVDDYYSGMLVCLSLHQSMLKKGMGLDAIREMMAEHYAGQKLVHVMTAQDEKNMGGMLAANALSGRDDMEIWVTGNDSRMVLMARFDNLGKGASGAAVQCLNMMMGREETTGLYFYTNEGEGI